MESFHKSGVDSQKTFRKVSGVDDDAKLSEKFQNRKPILIDPKKRLVIIVVE